MSLTYFAQSLGVTNLSFTFRLTRSPQSLQREWRQSVFRQRMLVLTLHCI